MQPRPSVAAARDASTALPARTPALVPAVTRALTLLDRLAECREPMSLARLASDLALPKSSVHGLCTTLMTFGYLRRRTDGAFLIGPRVMTLAEAFVAGTGVAQEFGALWHDAAAPDETLILSVLDGAEVVYVAVRHGTRPLGLAFTVGMRLPAHLAATGKAMLAHLLPSEVRRLYPGRTLPRLTRRGPATPAVLLKELAATRERGHAVDDENVREGVYCLAAPVFGVGGATVAAIGICTHKAEGTPEARARHLRTVLAAAHTLSQRLGGESHAVPAPAADVAAPSAPRAPRASRPGLDRTA